MVFTDWASIISIIVFKLLSNTGEGALLLIGDRCCSHVRKSSKYFINLKS